MLAALTRDVPAARVGSAAGEAGEIIGPMAARIEHIVTSGTFSLDGQDFAVDNNVWLVGDDHEVVVIDAAHDAPAILAAVGGRRLVAVVSTHGHNDHITAAPQVARETGAPVLLHPADRVLWDLTYPDQVPDGDLGHEEVIEIAATPLRVLHTPGHSPGSVCLYAPALGTVFSGDTLFEGGPGATGRSYSDYPAIVTSIRNELMGLPPETVVRTGHGPQTTVAAEAPRFAG
jgi:glyoxylase-like metal-dependent hydrolase (beta-lactamase superfamily II)